MPDLFRYRKLIETINEEQSFSKAANRLFMPQPSLSVIVKKLEDEIGIPLFDRTTKPIRLTDAGREYLNTANEIDLAERAFENYIDSINQLQNGYLRIGTNQLLSDLVMPEFLSSFMRKWPGIRIETMNADSDALGMMLQEGRLDLVIDNHPLDSRIFDQRELFYENIVLAVPDSFHLDYPEGRMTAQDVLSPVYAEKPPIDLHQLKDVPFILLTKGNETRQLTDILCRHAGFSPNILLEVDRLTTVFRYTTIGAGISFISDTLLRYMDTIPGNVGYYRSMSKYSTRPVFISVKHSRYYSRAMDLIHEELNKWFSEQKRT